MGTNNELPAIRYKLRNKEGDPIYIIVCFDDDETPIEVFAKFPYEHRPERSDRATMWTTTCRLVSLALRDGTDIGDIIEQLEKSSGHMMDLPAQLSKLFKRFLSRSSRGYSTPCPECEEGTLVFKEGCETCQSCGYSKCS